MPALSRLALAGPWPTFYGFPAMAAGAKSGDPKRAERLKSALRENLKRRKAQEKARGRAAPTTPDTHEKAAHPPRGKQGG